MRTRSLLIPDRATWRRRSEERRVGKEGGARWVPNRVQAEDGIRDIGVTGVQTCALPISNTCRHRNAPCVRSPGMSHGDLLAAVFVAVLFLGIAAAMVHLTGGHEDAFPAHPGPSNMAP